MWPESARGLRHRWRGFSDPLGDRIVVEATTGIRSEGLVVSPSLVQSADAVAALCESVADLSDVSHPALRSPREVQRLTREGGRPVVVSDYAGGRRLAEWLAAREGAPLSTGCVLHIALQVGGALAAIAEHQTGAFHGAVGLERVALTPGGKVLLIDAGVGALLAAQPERSPEEWWREFRVAIPGPWTAAAFGQTTDACQLGTLVLELLLGRQIEPADYPEKIAFLLGSASETDLLGNQQPLGSGLFEWLGFTLGIGPGEAPPTMPVVLEGLENLLSDLGGYVAVSDGLDATPESLVPWPFPVEELAPFRVLTPPPAQSVERAWPHTSAQPSPVQTPSRSSDSESELMAARVARGLPIETLDLEWDDFHTSETAESRDFSSFRRAGPSKARPAGRVATPPRPSRIPGPTRQVEAPLESPAVGWTRLLRWGALAVVMTAALAGAGWFWLQLQDRRAGPPTATLDVESEPAGATILINGLDRGKAPVSLVVHPGRHEITAKSALGIGTATVDVQRGRNQRAKVALQLGTDPGMLDISTEPSGAHVTLDNAPQGRAPLVLDAVPPGDHQLVVELGAVRIERRFTLAPTERLTLFVPLAGWVSVRSRLPLEVMERGRSFGSTTGGRVLVPAGRRRLQLVNDEFGVNTTQEVVVVAGQVANVAVSLPAGMLSVVTDEPADVWVDGEPRGRSPTGNLSVALGEHEVLVTHPRWGEQRLTVIVGLGAPTRLTVKLAGADRKRGPQRGSPKRSGISAAR